MAEQKQYIAVDLGAESGRVMLGNVSDDKLELKEIHRFSNSPLEQDNSLKWDFNKLFLEIKTGITKAVKDTDREISGIGVDSWGVDFGLIDSKGSLIENPYNYRDSRTDGIMDKAFELMPDRDIYENTGIQFMPLNTIFQLFAAAQSDSPGLKKTDKITFMADLVSYHLCGRLFGEYTLASTSQLMDMKTGQWSKKIFDKLRLPLNIMPDVIPAGTVAADLKQELADEFRCEPIPIIAVGSHDTASAVAAVPAKEDNWAYLSSGTWSLMGVEIPKAIINDKTFEYSFTNEGGVQDTIRLLKNIMGLWLIQESRRYWQKKGESLSYAEITELAESARPFAAIIDPNNPSFLAPGNMPKRINEYLKSTSQTPIDDKGQLIRTILESLALYYRLVMERIEEIIDNKIEVLHMVGGGIQNELLCQFTANALGRKVITGPIEATASGNILMQAMAKGQINSLDQARELISKSFELKEYLPEDKEIWDKEYKKAVKLFS